jgi:hypothetical protein
MEDNNKGQEKKNDQARNEMESEGSDSTEE